MTRSAEALLSNTRLIPVAVIKQETHAVPLAETLLEAGISTIEVTLRTPVALKAIEQIAQRVPELIVGAGSAIEKQHLTSAANAGAQYAVSPGYTDELLSANVLPYLPGASTAAEVMYLRERGFFFQKFFPAEAMGGLATLQAIHAPLSDVKFCPTGGITAALAPAYLAQDYVAAIGGSWFLPAEALDKGDFVSISAAAKLAWGQVDEA